jgi:hypothetical protein
MGANDLNRELQTLRSRLEEELVRKHKEQGDIVQAIRDIESRLEAVSRLLGSTQPISNQDKQPQLSREKAAAQSDGGFTPSHWYWPYILQSLIELGGSARGDDVLKLVGTKMMKFFTSGDRELLPSGMDVRWRNRAAWQRYNMVQQGLLRSDSRRGVWEITDAGRRWFEDVGHRKQTELNTSN